jgi:prepilin-type processing-associated H-X9-DG protein
MLLPALEQARESAQSAKCINNLKQIATAQLMYAGENADCHILACEDMFGPNHTRWCGRRSGYGEPYDPSTSALAPYLGMYGSSHESKGLIKECPAFYDKYGTDEWNASFEYGTGGYGMNTYAGSRMFEVGFGGFTEHLRLTEVKYPSEFLVFGDAGYYNGDKMTEYSLLEAPSWAFTAPVTAMPNPPMRPNPSMLGRHNGMCNVSWADGHVGSESIAFSSDYITHGSLKDPIAKYLGWIREDDFHIWVPRPVE